MWNLLGRVVVGSWIARRVGSWLAEGDEACGVERGRRRGEVERGLVRAVEVGDYGEFKRLYRLEYPAEDESRIEEEWEWRVECSEEN